MGKKNTVIFSIVVAAIPLFFLFQNFTNIKVDGIANNCTSPEILEQNIGKHWYNQNLYVVNKSLNLCPDRVYSRGLYVNTSDIQIDCKGAVFFDQQTISHGFFIENADRVKISNCTFKNFKGNMAVRNYRRSGIHPITGEKISFNQLGEDSSSLYNKDDIATYAYSPLDKIQLINVKVLNSGGTIMRMRNSTITKSEFSGGGLGLYVEADSYNNLITKSIFSNSTDREGLILDGAYENIVSENKIFNNRTNGISIYKNCGEDMGMWKRNYPASKNIIKNNIIFGHNKRTRSVITISEGAGIAVGLRQGLSFINSDLSQLTASSDLRCHMFPWYRVNEEIFNKVKTQPDYKINVDELTSLSKKKYYIGPHWDFADENIISNNIIFDNLIGLYVSARNTQVKGNRFFRTYSEPTLNKRDVIFGNFISDSINKSILGLVFEDNLFDWRSKPRLFASSERAQESITVNNNRPSLSLKDFSVMPLKDSYELLEFNSRDKSRPMFFEFLDL